MQPLVPAGFAIPQRLDTPQFFLRPMLISDVVRDYDAVMSSIAHLQGIFGPGNDWPRPDLSFEQDLIDLGWHHAEFQMRRSFAYTVLRPDGEQCLGCAYIYRGERAGFDARAFCWVRASHAALDGALFAAFRGWLATDWPFRQVEFPGRDHPW